MFWLHSWVSQDVFHVGRILFLLVVGRKCSRPCRSFTGWETFLAISTAGSWVCPQFLTEAPAIVCHTVWLAVMEGGLMEITLNSIVQFPKLSLAGFSRKHINYENFDFVVPVSLTGRWRGGTPVPHNCWPITCHKLGPLSRRIWPKYRRWHSRGRLHWFHLKVNAFMTCIAWWIWNN